MYLIDVCKERFGKQPPRFESHLREVRELAGLNQGHLAEYCQVSIETIELIENSKYEPSVVLAEHLARCLNTTVETLFTAHPPTGVLSGDSEERIRSQLGRIGLWSSYGMIAASLIGAAILAFLANEQVAGIAVFVVGMLGYIIFLICLGKISGYERYSRRKMKAYGSKFLFWYRLIWTPLIMASAMTLTSKIIHSWQSGIILFLCYALAFGGGFFLLEYRKLKPKK